METQNIQTFIVYFKNGISLWELPLFRGCVINAMQNANVLFHNHLNDDELRYRYPLIQYKRINGKAAIIFVGDGTEAIGNFFNQANFRFKIGGREEFMEIDHVEVNRTLFHLDTRESKYVIRKWLPLSSSNYHTYLGLSGLMEQCGFLQNIMIGNILSLCKGMDITIDEEITCTITNIIDTRIYTHKGVKMMGFDVEFKSNVSLPDLIGLGKGVGFGFGTVVKSNQ